MAGFAIDTIGGPPSFYLQPSFEFFKPLFLDGGQVVEGAGQGIGGGCPRQGRVGLCADRVIGVMRLLRMTGQGSVEGAHLARGVVKESRREKGRE